MKRVSCGSTVTTGSWDKTHLLICSSLYTHNSHNIVLKPYNIHTLGCDPTSQLCHRPLGLSYSKLFMVIVDHSQSKPKASGETRWRVHMLQVDKLLPNIKKQYHTDSKCKRSGPTWNDMGRHAGGCACYRLISCCQTSRNSITQIQSVKDRPQHKMTWADTLEGAHATGW